MKPKKINIKHPNTHKEQTKENSMKRARPPGLAQEKSKCNKPINTKPQHTNTLKQSHISNITKIIKQKYTKRKTRILNMHTTKTKHTTTHKKKNFTPPNKTYQTITHKNIIKTPKITINNNNSQIKTIQNSYQNKTKPKTHHHAHNKYTKPHPEGYLPYFPNKYVKIFTPQH